MTKILGQLKEDTLIELKNVNKIYNVNGNVINACKNINLKIEKNDIYGIMGLSGAGKSTLLRTLNLLETPTSGNIIVNGEDITLFGKEKLREYRKKTGMIFQHFNLLESRNVRGNIAFALEVAGWKNKKDINKRVDELLSLVELEDKGDFYPVQLSGGQKQRVGIARALANSPDILLSDEATSALDPKTTKSILDLLRNIQKQLGLTIILITHQMEVIKAACNKAAILEKGEVIEDGSVEEIFSNPKSSIAKEFVSHMVHEEVEEIDYIKREGKKIIKVSYLGEKSKRPFISHLIKEFHIDISIISGSIDKLTSTNVGHLILELDGEESMQNKSIEWLIKNNLGVEVIFNG